MFSYLFFFSEIFEQDLGDSFKLAPSTEGLSKVHLKCGADSMHVCNLFVLKFSNN